MESNPESGSGRRNRKAPARGGRSPMRSQTSEPTDSQHRGNTISDQVASSYYNRARGGRSPMRSQTSEPTDSQHRGNTISDQVASSYYNRARGGRSPMRSQTSEPTDSQHRGNTISDQDESSYYNPAVRSYRAGPPELEEQRALAQSSRTAALRGGPDMRSQRSEPINNQWAEEPIPEQAEMSHHNPACHRRQRNRSPQRAEERALAQPYRPAVLGGRPTMRARTSHYNPADLYRIRSQEMEEQRIVSQSSKSLALGGRLAMRPHTSEPIKNQWRGNTPAEVAAASYYNAATRPYRNRSPVRDEQRALDNYRHVTQQLNKELEEVQRQKEEVLRAYSSEEAFLKYANEPRPKVPLRYLVSPRELAERERNLQVMQSVFKHVSDDIEELIETQEEN